MLGVVRQLSSLFHFKKRAISVWIMIILVLQLYLMVQFSQISQQVTSLEPVINRGVKPRSDSCIPKNHRLFPLCEEKFKVVQKNINKFECFKDVHLLDGSNCSTLNYLTNIEPYCRPIKKLAGFTTPPREESKAKLEFNLKGALSLLPDKEFQWLRTRLTNMWTDWQEAAQLLKSNKNFKEGKKKKILVYLGSMDYQREILKRAGKGGFVGELVQWTDLIASAYILGHEIKVVLNGTDLSSGILQPDEKGCASKNDDRSRLFDLIFTDFNGLTIIGLMGSSNLARLRCKVRVLDSFGTEAEFNYKGYADNVPGGRSTWGLNNLLLQQLLTYLPHSPDNMFLGFAGGNGKLDDSYIKKNQAVIYGKLGYYLEGMRPYLDIIKEHFEIHATMAKPGDWIPPYVINHGVVDSKRLKKLLAESKIFIGLGFPFEGPGPFDAISNGAVFVNPKFNPPKNKFNDDFFKGKPTLRKLTSQNPYLEDFVGEPYVYTVDIHNKTTLEDLLVKLKKRQTFKPYMPREFTNIGMLERIHALIQHQDFCDVNAPRWPPLNAMTMVLGTKGTSCKNECRKRGLLCEPSYFTDINSIKSFQSLGIQCKKITRAKKLYHPAYDPSTRRCYIQDHILYFSCVAEDVEFQRICACRNFRKGQTALCEKCL